ncbi:hypothetical protein DSY14_27655, partial [Nocardiopsis sp. MG754419]|nr:hypothetical protein [Nocardiopsis sp. MG754419]
LHVRAAAHPRFTRLTLPAAPWVFTAAGIAYAIMPAIAQDRLDTWTTLYATAPTVLTLGAEAGVQNLLPWIDRRTGGRAPMSTAMLLAVIAALVGHPAPALLVAVVLGTAYGICVVAGLLHVQAIAAPRELAGLTGVYYSLAYTGFLLPTLPAALLPLFPYAASLGAVAVVCLACLVTVTRGTGPGGRGHVRPAEREPPPGIGTRHRPPGTGLTAPHRAERRTHHPGVRARCADTTDGPGRTRGARPGRAP